jgi:hypothetical protein
LLNPKNLKYLSCDQLIGEEEEEEEEEDNVNNDDSNDSEVRTLKFLLLQFRDSGRDILYFVNFKETELGDVNWIHLTHHGEECWPVVNTVMALGVL